MPGLAEEPRGRADEDEVAVTRPLDLAQEGTRSEVGERQVPANRLLPARERQLPHRDVLFRPLARDCGADIEPSQCRHGLREELVDLLLSRQVGSEQRRSAELIRECFASLKAEMEVQRNTSAFRREGAGAGGADAPGGARDEHALAAKPRFHGREATAGHQVHSPPGRKRGDMTPADDLTDLQVGLAILDTLDPNDELTREELDLLAWRFEQLLGHGYGVEEATEIARAKHVDLELARSLTRKFGCSPELAARILL